MKLPYLQYRSAVGEGAAVAKTAAIIGRSECGVHLTLRDYATVRADGEHIRIGDNAYGVPISELERRTGRDVAISSVYAALERLEEKGFVASELGEATAERGGRAKRYFRVTGCGLKEVRETQRALMKLWHGLPAVRQSALLRPTSCV